MRMETHEIIMDNDILLLKSIPQIEQFLSDDKKVMILEEPIRFYGRYDALFPGDPPYLNSGLIGLPPGFDYGKEIAANWHKHGKYMNMTQADEQGLLTYTLSQQPNIRIHSDQMKEFLGRDYTAKVTGEEAALHFTQANRMPRHRGWLQYCEMKK